MNDRSGPSSPPRIRGRRFVAAWVAALVAAAAGLALAQRQEVAPADPVARAPDAFYTPPSLLPDRPGVLLRAEPLAEVTLPAGVKAWRILYTTTIDDRTPATAVATIFAPAAPATAPRPVILWAHGTTGLVQRCMPSLLSAPALGIPAVEPIVAAGFAIVATDYSFAEPGGPHPYLIGEGEARAGLDSIRAARQMRGLGDRVGGELDLDPRVAVWGHSQGGHAALWTGIVGPRYAPEIPLVGVAAIAPAANVADVVAGNPFVDRRLGPYLAAAYSRFYPDVSFDRAVRPNAVAAASQMAGLCGFLPPEDPRRSSRLAATFSGPVLAAADPALAARLAENTANRPIAAPVMIAQGLADEVVRAEATDTYVAERCAAGQALAYWTFPSLDHGTIVWPGNPFEAPLVAWTKARFAGEPPPSGCDRRRF